MVSLINTLHNIHINIQFINAARNSDKKSILTAPRKTTYTPRKRGRTSKELG